MENVWMSPVMEGERWKRAANLSCRNKGRGEEDEPPGSTAERCQDTERAGETGLQLRDLITTLIASSSSALGPASRV